ncbi:hypothetical protein GCM10010399_04710 [Dactylosporangium fulvum]|uniref:DinB family protein n=1 Tax=Dactylosporangium fulvum TaxID=53359 RepID=A0ABY5VU63_9ACTN|nr:hypothetical protein [Dactylosporangium fulvum]UWP81323.1 hypothetical protein Dfulv_40405 [Dactylosporangium fulvum]
MPDADTHVYLEATPKKVFAGSLDWPGWGRFAKTEEAALEALAGYAERYAPIAAAAGFSFPTTPRFTVVERVPGTSTTEFGAPDGRPAADGTPVTKATADRHTKLLRAAWAAFEDRSATAPESLRKGPRGGGRDRDKMIDHLIDSEAAYARKIGVKHRPPAIDDSDAIEALRTDVLAVLGRPSDGGPLTTNGWTARYAARRFVWHVLDHLWEMEDRSE